MIALCGGADVRCAPYATFGTPELAENAVRGLEGRKAVLIEVSESYCESAAKRLSQGVLF